METIVLVRIVADSRPEFNRGLLRCRLGAQVNGMELLCMRGHTMYKRPDWKKIVVACLPLVLVAMPAEAAEVTVWNLNVSRLPAKLQRATRSSVRAELQTAGWSVKEPQGKRRKQAQAAQRRCKAPTLVCAAQAGEAMGAAQVLTGEVSGRAGQWNLSLLLVDADAEKIIGEASGVLHKATLAEDAAQVARALVAAGRPLAAEPLQPMAEAPSPPHPPGEPAAAELTPPPDALPAAGPLAASAPPPASAKASGSPDSDDALALAPPPVAPLAAHLPTDARAPIVELVAAPVDEAPGAAGQEQSLGFLAGLHLDVLLPSGQTGGASYNTNLKPSGSRTATFAVMAEGRVRLPSPAHDLSIALEVGWYRLGAKGSRKSPGDPDFGDVSFSWTLHSLPILLGPYYRLPLPGPLDISVGAGVVYQRVWVATTYEANGQSVKNATQADAGFGFHATAEAGLPLGPGLLVGSLRYTQVRTDLNFKTIYEGAYNETPGDVGGASVLVGYRFAF